VITFALTDIEMWLGAIFWPFVRILAMISAAPVLSHRAIPGRAKIGLALLIAFAASSMTGQQPAAVFTAHAPLLLIQQMLIGFAMGFAIRLVFAAAELAGDMIGLQMGLSFATFVDPTSSGQTPIIGTFIGLCATLLFLALDGHLALIAGVTASFQSAPVDPAFFSALDWHRLASLGSLIFVTGLQIALPVLATMLAINLTMGVMSRAAPQLNLFSIGFPLTVISGLLVLALFLPQLLTPLTAALQSNMTAF
jgi:flagellar biosynthetic protein FliR